MRTFAQKQNQHQKPVSSSLARSNIAKPGPDHREHPILHLQRAIGTRAVQRMSQEHGKEPEARSTDAASPRFGHDFCRIPVRPPTAGSIQTKLAINKPGDEYEQEADRVVEQLMRMPESHLQRACSCGGGCPKCQTEQIGQGHDRLHTKRVGSSDCRQAEAPPIIRKVLHSSGQPIDRATRDFMEPRFRHDFSRVQVHADDKAADSARAVHARAYTLGQHVVFAAGEYQPASEAGRRLLAHELTHVIQQSRAASVLQRQETPPMPRASSLRVGIIPVREFIRHVEMVERAYPTKSPQEILTDDP